MTHENIAAQILNLRRNNRTCGANVKRSNLLSKYCGASNFIAAQFTVFQQKGLFGFQKKNIPTLCILDIFTRNHGNNLYTQVLTQNFFETETHLKSH